eukprot:jgi/Tetstr1/452674/TSEL_039710.t1
MISGKVKFFNATKGFGFIQPDQGGEDAFVHISAVERAGMATLVEGQAVSPQRKYAEMEARQKEALRQEEIALDATRAKTERLKALRLEKERKDAIEKAAKKAVPKKKAADPGSSPGMAPWDRLTSSGELTALIVERFDKDRFAFRLAVQRVCPVAVKLLQVAGRIASSLNDQARAVQAHGRHFFKRKSDGLCRAGESSRSLLERSPPVAAQIKGRFGVEIYGLHMSFWPPLDGLV